ncbi:MAG TPA: hypothetical protein VL359_17835 [bacterium]|nr:hypothetical protein [bacterium]
MRRRARLATAAAAGLLMALALVACAPRQPAPPAPGSDRFRPFLIPGSLAPFEALGVAQFTYKGQAQSGELLLRAQPGPSYQLQLRAPVTGSLALELRFDAQELLVLDYAKRSYFFGDNTPESRQALFSVDLDPEEFAMVVTGRVLQAWYQAGGGRSTAPGEVEFSRGEDRYRFHLDAEGLPQSWEKLHAGSPVFSVEYRSYLSLPLPAGPPLRLPQRIRVFFQQRQPALVLGISQVDLGTAGAPVEFNIPPDVLQNFQAE